MSENNPMNGEQSHAPGLCGARTRAGGECKRPALTNGRCHLHGGRAPKGIASPHFKHGRYSKYLPRGIVGAYEEALADPELMSLRPGAALLEARVTELLKRLRDKGEEMPDWKALERKYGEFERARQRGDSDWAARSLVELGELIRAGSSIASVWAEIGDTIEQRRKITETETRRKERERLVLSVEEAVLLLSALADVVRRHVHDRRALQNIQEDMARLMPPGQQIIDIDG